MNSSFVALNGNRFTRKWGGTDNAVDPYITGYFHTYWQYVPSGIATAVRSADNVSFSDNDIKTIMAASCLSVTIPGATVNKAEFTGLGGSRWAVPTNVEWDNTITLKFLEFSSLPIFSIIHGWVRLLRDYRTGVSSILSNASNLKSNYSGTMLYWTTRPDTTVVEYSAAFSGMFPLKDPTDQYGSDIATYDKLELDIDFNTDYVWHEGWVKEACQTKMDDVVALSGEDFDELYDKTTIES
jgi:hypothetical protein